MPGIKPGMTDRRTALSFADAPCSAQSAVCAGHEPAGVGPKQDKLLRYLLDREETPRLVDLLLHLPASVIDRRARPKIRDAVPGTVVTLEVTVDRHRRPRRATRARRYLVYASDDTGDVVLTFFRAKPGYVEKLLPSAKALRLRHAADVRRHPADRASRPRRR
jgi:ATP-dependent DNA helicase RecG